MLLGRWVFPLVLVGLCRRLRILLLLLSRTILELEVDDEDLGCSRWDEPVLECDMADGDSALIVYYDSDGGFLGGEGNVSYGYVEVYVFALGEACLEVAVCIDCLYLEDFYDPAYSEGEGVVDRLFCNVYCGVNCPFSEYRRARYPEAN